MSKPGAVRITLQTNNNEVDEKAEVTVALANPEVAVERMIQTLAQRFPPESVMTIQPSKGRAGEGSPTSSASPSRSSSRSTTDPTVHLSPEARAGLSVFPPDLTNWILSTSPTIVRALLPLAMQGGDTKSFATRYGLSQTAVDRVVKELMNDSEFYDWVDNLTANISGSSGKSPTSKSKKSSKKSSKSPTSTTGAPIGFPSPIGLTSSGSPSAGGASPAMAGAHWVVDNNGKVVGHLGPNNQPVLHNNGAGGAFKFETERIPRNPMRPSDGYWLLSTDGALIGHTDSQGRSIMHPQRPFPPGSGQPTGLNGINIVSRDPSAPELGGPWLVDNDGAVVGHFDTQGHPVLHPNFRCRFNRLVSSPVAGYNAIHMDPEAPTKGVWLLDSENNVVGHVGADGVTVMHPMVPLNADAPSALRGVHTVNRNPARPDLGGPWLIDDSGMVIGHWGPDGRVVLHPMRKGSSRSPSPVNVPIGGPQFDASIDMGVPGGSYNNQFQTGGGQFGMTTVGGDNSYQTMPPAYGNGSASGQYLSAGSPMGNTNYAGMNVGSNGQVSPSHQYQSGGPATYAPNGAHGAAIGSGLPSGDMYEYDAEGNRVRYVEVEVEQWDIKEVPKIEVREIVKKVPKQEIKVNEKRVEVITREYVECPVDKIIEEEVIVEKKVRQVVQVPKVLEKIVKKEEVVVTEKIVNEPQMIEVERPYTVTQNVPVARYVNREQPTMVAQKLKPIIREADKPRTVEAKLYEPMLYAVDVFVPKPVQSTFIPLGKVDETHNPIEIPAPQFNSLLKAMNQGKPEEALQDLYVRGVGGTIPLLPVGELAEIVPPHPSAFARPPVQSHKRDRGHTRSPHKRRSAGKRRH